MADDIEHLKTLKLPPKRDGRVHLSVAGQQKPSEDDSEAYGGNPEAEVPAVPEEALRERIVEALKTVYDPEIPLNLYDLGLIYGVDIDPEQNVEITMTLTAPGCPVAGTLVHQVAERVGSVEGVRRSHVELTWDPPWTQDRMTDEAKLELGLL